MVLTAASLAHYLLERGLADPASVIDGDFQVHDLSRRNCVFQVWRGPHRAYFVKQVKEWKADSLETLEREASFYSLLRSDPELGALRRFVPVCYAYDAADQVLVLEQAVDTGRTRLLAVEEARCLGSSLRQWHEQARAAKSLRDSPESDIEILRFHHTPEESDSDPDAEGAANAELLRVVKREAAFGRALDALMEQWRADTLIHGDMRLDNCLISADGAVKFIDWEMAGWGDPLWDVAGLVQDYLMLWVLGDRPVAEVAPAIRAFWNAYGAERDTRERAMGYAAARMIQSACEYQRKGKQMTAPAIRLLQASRNILTAPSEAIRVFFEGA
jgi:aminoglycoside phosphotransferase